MNIQPEKLRLDKYLWSIRFFKTRSQAADACDKGKVKCLGNSAKAARSVNVNDEYEVKTEAKKWVIKVTGLLHSRVQYAEAIKFYQDITPPEELPCSAVNGPRSTSIRAADARSKCETWPCPSGPVAGTPSTYRRRPRTPKVDRAPNPREEIWMSCA